MEDYWPLIAFGLIILLLAPLVMSIIALAATSRLRLNIESLERRVAWLANPKRSDVQADEKIPARTHMPEPAPVQATPERVTPPIQPIIPPPQPITSPPQPVMPPPQSTVAAPVAPKPELVTAQAQPVMHPAPEPRPKKPALDWESVIAGNWLNRIGILALLVAAAFFLKFAFDNNWINQYARVAIGIAAGSGLLLYSRSLFKQGYVYFSEGIVALGVGVLYLSLYAGWNFYHFIPLVPAFLGMAAVTALTLGISFARNSERLALLTLVGGFLTPLLLNTGKDAEIGLFSYLAVLNAGLLWASYSRNWRSLPIAFAITVIYGVAWYLNFYVPAKLAPTVFFATLFFVEFSVLPVLRALRTGVVAQLDVAIVFLNPMWFVPALVSMLYADHRILLAACVAALAVGHYLIARRSPVPAQGVASARIVFELLAVTLLAVAIAIGLRANWILVGWAIEAAALVQVGLRTSNRYLRWEGLGLFLLVSGRLLATHIDGGRFLINLHFLTYAVVIASAAFAAYQAARDRSALDKAEVGWFKALEVVANGLAVVALTAELWNLPLDESNRLLLMPLLWTAYATALMLLGATRGSAIMQWQGAVLTFLSVACAFGQHELGLAGLLTPIRMQTFWMSIAWALVAAAFVWAGFHWRAALSRGTGVALFFATAVGVFAGHIDGGRFLINPRFEAIAIVVACLGFAAYQARLYPGVLAPREGIYYKLLGVAGNALIVSALSRELWSLPVSRATHELLQALLWSVYAGALIVNGAIRSSPWRTWQGAALLLLAAGSAVGSSLVPVQSMSLVSLWALEGAVFVWAGLRWTSRFARAQGLVLLAWVSLLLVLGFVDGGRLLLNPRFAAFTITIACLGFVSYQLQLKRSVLSAGEAGIQNVINVSINILALWGLSHEVLDLGGSYLTKQLILTVLWTGYAALLMFLGLRRASPLLRWQSLVLLALVIVKVVAFDLSQLPLGLRILSFFALGVVLVGVSFFYQRRVQSRRSEKET